MFVGNFWLVIKFGGKKPYSLAPHEWHNNLIEMETFRTYELMFSCRMHSTVNEKPVRWLRRTSNRMTWYHNESQWYILSRLQFYNITENISNYAMKIKKQNKTPAENECYHLNWVERFLDTFFLITSPPPSSTRSIFSWSAH